MARLRQDDDGTTVAERCELYRRGLEIGNGYRERIDAAGDISFGLAPMSTKQIRPRPIAWSIAGSDSGGGAGIQADLLTFHDFDVYGCSVITASTAQNSVSVNDVFPLPVAHVQRQLETLATDLLPCVIKIGMLANAEIVDTVCAFLENYKGRVIYDPVLQSSTGGSLFDDINHAQLQRLFSHIDLLTPNIPEAEWLTGKIIRNSDDMESAARQLCVLGCKSVLITGGHAVNSHDVCRDYFCDGQQGYWLVAERVSTSNSHGSGCTLSSAITAVLAAGLQMDDALVIGRAYVVQGIRAAIAIGRGAGAVAHAGFPAHIQDFPGIGKNCDAIATQSTSRFSFASCDTKQLGLYPVVDTVEWIERLLPLGVKTIQLRVKTGSADELDQQIAAAVAIGKRYQARLFINDYWELAIKHGAYGVHLGQEDLDTADLQSISDAGLRLGVSTHSWWEIARAHAIRPSYIAIGPIYETTTKQMRFSQQGLKQLAQWVNLLKQEYPIVAIGGIDYERSKPVLETGVGSIAMVSAITKADDYVAVVNKLLELLDTASGL